MHHEHPQLVRDQYWDEIFPQELPYTLASEPFREKHPEPSTANIYVKNHEAEPIIPPNSVKIDDGVPYNNDMNSAPITFTAKTSDSTNALEKQAGSDASMKRSRSRGSQVCKNPFFSIIYSIYFCSHQWVAVRIIRNHQLELRSLIHHYLGLIQ